MGIADGPSTLGLAANHGGSARLGDGERGAVCLIAAGCRCRIRPDTWHLSGGPACWFAQPCAGWSGRVRVPDLAVAARSGPVGGFVRRAPGLSFNLLSVAFRLGGDHARCLRIAPSAGAGTVVAAHGGAVGAGLIAACRRVPGVNQRRGAVGFSRDSSGASALRLAGRFAAAVGAGSFAFCQQLDWDEFVVARTRFATPAGCRLVASGHSSCHWHRRFAVERWRL